MQIIVHKYWLPFVSVQKVKVGYLPIQVIALENFLVI